MSDLGGFSMTPGTTRELEKILNSVHSKSDLEDYLRAPGHMAGAGSFAEYYGGLPQVQAAKRADLVQSSGIERTYCYQILSGRKTPGRDKILALCLAAGLPLKETQRALEIAGEAALYSRNRRDAILIYSINHHFTRMQADELLEHFEERSL